MLNEEWMRRVPKGIRDERNIRIICAKRAELVIASNDVHCRRDERCFAVRHGDANTPMM